MVKLRFMRIGKKNRPYYRLCAVDARRPRDGEYLELLGIYDPLIRDDLKKFRINKERAEYWLSVGAQPTEGVYPFLKKAHVVGLFKPKKAKHPRPKKVASAPSPSASSASSSSSAPASSAGSTRKPKPPKKPRTPKDSKGEAPSAQA
mgnify:CR=1 FL=1